MMTEKDRFAAVSDAGRRYTIVVHQHWRTWQPLDGPAQRVRGATELFTDDGQDVNQNSDGTYTIVMTDEVLRRAT
jgi:hypothetical protein